DRSEAVAPVERGARIAEMEILPVDRPDGGARQNRRQQAVVGSQEDGFGSLRSEQAPGTADAGIHHREIDRPERKPATGCREEEARLSDVARCDVVGDVDQAGFRGEGQDHPLDRGDVPAVAAEIGQEGDDGVRGHSTEKVVSPTGSVVTTHSQPTFAVVAPVVNAAPAGLSVGKKLPAAVVSHRVFVLEPLSTGLNRPWPKLLSSVSVAPVVVPTLSYVIPAQSVVVAPAGTGNPAPSVPVRVVTPAPKVNGLKLKPTGVPPGA